MLYDITYVWDIKKNQTSEYNKYRLTDTEKKTSGYQWGEGRGGGGKLGWRTKRY